MNSVLRVRSTARQSSVLGFNTLRYSSNNLEFDREFQ